MENFLFPLLCCRCCHTHLRNSHNIAIADTDTVMAHMSCDHSRVLTYMRWRAPARAPRLRRLGRPTPRGAAWIAGGAQPLIIASQAGPAVWKGKKVNASGFAALFKRLEISK